jgi:hypothetical protein
LNDNNKLFDSLETRITNVSEQLDRQSACVRELKKLAGLNSNGAQPTQLAPDAKAQTPNKDAPAPAQVLALFRTGFRGRRPDVIATLKRKGYLGGASAVDAALQFLREKKLIKRTPTGLYGPGAKLVTQ